MMGPSMSSGDRLRRDLERLGADRQAVREALRAAGLEREPPADAVRRYLETAGWRDPVIEPLGDSGWLCARARTDADEAAGADLPDAVVAYVNARERYPDPELAE